MGPLHLEAIIRCERDGDRPAFLSPAWSLGLSQHSCLSWHSPQGGLLGSQLEKEPSRKALDDERVLQVASTYAQEAAAANLTPCVLSMFLFKVLI